MGSTRFPGKPLADLAGKPMVQWVYETALRANVADSVLIATPDDEILAAADGFGAEAVKTSANHPTGTDRIGEAVEQIEADVVVNVQGDEPLLPASTIAACARAVLDDLEVNVASVYTECAEAEVNNPAVVKVTTALNGDALYFSRHAIPFEPNPRPEPLKKHVGIYTYTREVLQRFVKLPPAPLEQTESLEQLRLLENGFRIRMVRGEASALAVDTPEQAAQVDRILREQREKGSQTPADHQLG
jgi:3-deoxy-manno-octulosonate cytidylyltransferase (CMP-KDO synthetase)